MLTELTQIGEIGHEESTSEKSDGIRTEIIPVSDEEEFIDFSNGPILTTIASIIFVVILAANTYVFVVLGKGTA